jgi:anti-sigma factor RsiW
MSVNHDQMTELLHAYVDGELDLSGSREFERHLQSCEDCRRGEEQIRTLHVALTSEAPAYRTPAHLRKNIRAALRREAKSGREIPWPWLAFAASTACAIAFAGLALFQSTRASRNNIADQVIANHIRSLLATHLLDVPSSDQHTVKPWFHGKIDFAPPVRDLSKDGFPLVGGRLDYLDGKAAVALVYQRNKHPINLFITPAPENRDRAPELITGRGYNVLHWIQGEMEYWAVSDLNQKELRQFADLLAHEASG